MTEKSTHKSSIEISLAVLSKIIWGVFQKFRLRHPTYDLNYEHNHIARSNNAVTADIFIYVHEKYSSLTDKIDETILNKISEALKGPHFKSEKMTCSIIQDAANLVAKIDNEEIVKLIKDCIESTPLSSFKEDELLISELRKDPIRGSKVQELIKTNKSYGNIDKDIEALIKKIECGLSERTQKRNNNPDKLIERSKFENIINIERKLIRSFGKAINIDIPPIQLEALCFYGWDKSYGQLLVSDDFYKHEHRIRFIPTELRAIFEPSLQRVLSAFKQADKRGGSDKMMSRACQIFIEQNKDLFKDFSEGCIPTQDYLKDLRLFMELSDRGFGVTIPKFDKYWESDEGKEVLALNEQQATGFKDENGNFKQFEWIRIFLVEGEQGNQKTLSEKETEMIKIQLNHRVRVFVVFKDAWNGISEDDLDIAVFRIDGSPSIMTTKFGATKAQGVFYTDESMPEIHYEQYLKEIIKPENAKSIFEPVPNEDNTAVILGAPFSGTGVIGLITILEAIYKKSK